MKLTFALPTQQGQLTLSPDDLYRRWFESLPPELKAAMCVGVQFDYELSRGDKGEYALTITSKNPIHIEQGADGTVRVYEKKTSAS